MKMMTGIAKLFAQAFCRFFPAPRQVMAAPCPVTAGGSMPWYAIANIDGRNQERPMRMLPLFPEDALQPEADTPAPFRYWEIHNIDGRDEEYPMAMLPLIPSGRAHRETAQAESREYEKKLSAPMESFFCCATG